MFPILPITGCSTLPSPTLYSLNTQVGRAGRDGSEASCWLVLDDADQQRLRSLSCSNAVEQGSVLAFLKTVRGGLNEDQQRGGAGDRQ